MEIVSNKKEIIFRHEKDGKVSYSIGLSHKTKEGTYENGYMPVRFKKDVNLENKTRIMIKQAWVDFYKNFNFFFINDFEVVDYIKEDKKDNWESAKEIEIEPDELPFY